MDYRINNILKEVSKGMVKPTIFDYEKSPHRILAAYANYLYRVDVGGGISVSSNYGETWKSLGVLNFSNIHITSNSIVYGFTAKPTRLYKSTDFENFTEVIMPVEYGDIDTSTWYGCDSNGNTLIFAEKNILQQNTVGGNSFARIFRTTDAGVTWNITLQQDLGHGVEGKIGHWHSVDYLGGATQYGVPEIWIATSGDYNINVRWWISKDNGATWTEIPGVQDQKYRTLVVNRQADKQLIWSTDAVPATLGGIYKCKDIDNVATTTELIHPIPLTSYGCIIRGKGVCITEREGNYARDGSVYLYATDDCGQTWNLEKEVPIRDMPVGEFQPGFHRIVGPDGQGNYYLTGYALKNVDNVIVKNKKQSLL